MVGKVLPEWIYVFEIGIEDAEKGLMKKENMNKEYYEGYNYGLKLVEEQKQKNYEQ